MAIKKGKQIIGLHSFSKAYGLAGIRLAYAFSTPEIAQYLNNARRPFMINTLTMEAGLAALTDVEHLEKTIQLNTQEKPYLYAELDKLGIHYWRTEANFILMKSPIPNAVLTPKMLENGIMIRPCEPFGMEGFSRITIGTHEANEAFIAALKKILS
ncbi:MAG: aminotransferase class I/II-fold pyridoxal phosphate-dependent enzyme [Saprospiraceae bacterium]|nr:aminotransferase class I/II-fold pyridoxal phosphate-dependent enzyme [Saprospiraceae bacterium]